MEVSHQAEKRLEKADNLCFERSKKVLQFLRGFHPRYNGQWPPTSNRFYAASGRYSWTDISKCDKSMNFCLVVVYVMKNISSYGPNLKIEIGGNDFYKIFQIVIVIDKLLTWNLINRVAMIIPIAMLSKVYENITDIEWRPSWKITNV